MHLVAHTTGIILDQEEDVVFAVEGKLYEIIDEDESYYEIVDETGFEHFYTKEEVDGISYKTWFNLVEQSEELIWNNI
ncbi:hypothetical protein BSK59_15815 [Paenibacillus odorifer]|uniref:hypothetical protein n=1 Tax=Paenibacillus odorifer TaxID=189426 RepID=UPI00096BDBDA|nr:hypothetical protein [Paenibacillus odorifer]OME54047.1 hypothetical protein BSK59_15815 [Paenibacillus odorifer]